MARTFVHVSNGLPVSLGFGLERFTAPAGEFVLDAARTNVQTIIREALTASDLYVRITANTLDDAATVTIDINGVDGNLTVSIGAGLTGEFEDVVNTDDIADADALLYTIDTTAAGAGSISISNVGSVFDHATLAYVFQIQGGLTYNSTSTQRFTTLNGAFQNPLLEPESQWTTRAAYTWRNLRLFFTGTSFNVLFDWFSRINAADGNMTLAAGSTFTGAVEDTVNTDSLAAGDEADIRGNETSGAGSVTLGNISDVLTNSGSIFSANASGLISLAFGITRFGPVQGRFILDATESDTEMKVRGMTLTARNLFLNVRTNTLDGATTLTLRINNGDGSLTLSVAAATTGLFEDTVNEDAIALDDEINYEITTAGAAGSILIRVTASEMESVSIAVDVLTARKYSLPEVGSDFAQKFDSDSKKYPIPISLLTAQKYRSSARKYPRTTS